MSIIIQWVIYRDKIWKQRKKTRKAKYAEGDWSAEFIRGIFARSTSIRGICARATIARNVSA